MKVNDIHKLSFRLLEVAAEIINTEENPQAMGVELHKALDKVLLEELA